MRHAFHGAADSAQYAVLNSYFFHFTAALLREQDAASHAADPGEGGEKHANSVSEKRKPRNRVRKSTGSENTPSKKDLGANVSVIESVKNNTDNENKTSKAAVAAKTTAKKHAGNKKDTDTSNPKDNVGHEKNAGHPA